MNILRVIASMDPASGGPCQGIRNTIGAMNDMDISNEVVSSDAPDALFLGQDTFKIHALGTRKNPWAYSKQLLPWLLENIPRFDAVIVHGLWLHPGYAVKKAMQKLNSSNRRPWYVMPHGMLDPYFQTSPDRKIKAARNNLYWQIIEKSVINNADAILFTSAEELLLAKNTFPGYHPKRSFNVGYGILPPPAMHDQMNNDFRKRAELDSDQSYFLFLSRIHPKKGVDLLIDAYADFVETYSYNGQIPSLVIAGPGLDSHFGKSLLEKARINPKLAPRIIFTGMLSGNEKWGALYGADVFILPSHQENFGIAVAESLACNTPVLISNKINIWREIEIENAGIVGNDTSEGTQQLIAKWMSLSENEKSEKKLNAARAFRNHFEINTNIRNLVKVLSGSFVTDKLE